jgi:hypothetical protein
MAINSRKFHLRGCPNFGVHFSHEAKTKKIYLIATLYARKSSGDGTGEKIKVVGMAIQSPLDN